MTNSPWRDGSDPTQQPGNSYPGYTDPAYASQAPYGPTYQAPSVPAPTQHLPQYSPYGYDPYTTSQYGSQYPPGESPPPPPNEPKSPRWLWVVAITAVLCVIGLVIALVIVNSSKQDQETVVAPAPPEPTTTSRTRPPTATRTPTIPIPLPTLPSLPPTTGSPAPSGQTETVVYDVDGNGRAINITYVDSGGLLQTEFNVLLPWSKEVQLSSPAKASASISIINVGREVNCSITIDGAVVEQSSGSGLTICTGAG